MYIDGLIATLASVRSRRPQRMMLFHAENGSGSSRQRGIRNRHRENAFDQGSARNLKHSCDRDVIRRAFPSDVARRPDGLCDEITSTSPLLELHANSRHSIIRSCAWALSVTAETLPAKGSISRDSRAIVCLHTSLCRQAVRQVAESR